MSDEKETIEDIVAEIRRQNPEKFLVSPWYCEPLPDRMRSYADRIESAYNREREAGAEAAKICGEIGEIVVRESAIAELKRENERLRAALKPVLDAYISQDNPSAEVYDSRLDAAVCVRAVRDAKRIYDGGEK